MANYLKIALISSTIGDLGADPETMVVRITDRANTSVDMTFTYAEQDSISVTNTANCLDGVYSGSHLIGLVSCFLWSKFNADHEFLHDVFYDEHPQASQQGELLMPIELPDYAVI